MNKKHLIIGASLLLLMGSCHDLDLTPLSKGSTENWYSSADEVKMAVNDLYRITFWQQDGDYYRTDWSDDYTYREELTAFESATVNGQNSFVTDKWSKSYKCIARANAVIARASKAIESGENAAVINRYIGEAHFFRAAMYTNLCTKFGDVPLVTKDIDIEEAFKMGRTPLAEVQQQIYADFDSAANVLPASYDGEQRITKGAALAYKARAALYLGDWRTAAETAKKVMDIGVYKLHPSYSDLFLQSTHDSPEFIFYIPRDVNYSGYLLQGSNVKFELTRNAGGWGSCCPSWDLLAAYTCTDGKPIDESPLFNPRKPFENRDPRLSMTIVPFNSEFLGYEYNPSPAATSVLNYKTGKQVTNQDTRAVAQYASYDGLVWKKGIDESWINEGYKIAPYLIIIRYAEVLLTYAEAKIELNEIDQSVIDAMNMVRARAYGVDMSNTSAYPAFTIKDQKQMRKELRVERRMEFAKEHMRYQDLIRWKLMGKVMTKKAYGMLYPSKDLLNKVVKKRLWFWPETPEIDEDGIPDFSNLEATGLVQVLSQRLWDDRQYLWPIPTAEVLINENMKQNPGY